MNRLSFASLLILLLFSIGFANYFQQHVSYHIKARLLPELNRIEGKEWFTYYNNSPDTLHFIYLHLYMNHFRGNENMNPGGRNQFGYIEILQIKDSLDREPAYQIDRTILKLDLEEALLPGESLEFYIRFNTILPPATERLGYYGNHYDVGNWYPVPAVYDEHGWHPDQHLEAEFYQEWGDYRVGITVPDGMVVSGSGVLLNPEVLPDSLEFAERQFAYYTPNDTATVTYQFEARRVHDFAWSADPEFVLRTIRVGEVEIRFFILPFRLKDWELQIKIAAKAFSLFEQKIGPYPYPALSVIDGYITAGGIEYPNLVIINDAVYDSLELAATIIHEISHQWFYGILANNQTRYGWMDEGFATYFENLGMSVAFPEHRLYIRSPRGWLGNYFGYWQDYSKWDKLLYLRYLREEKEEAINTPFDWFRGDPYIPTYQKASLVISQLQLLLGDSLFWEGTQKYYAEWKFRHPYPEDLISSFEEASGQQLDWFFNEWLNTTWHCDYAVEDVDGEWQTDSGNRIYKAAICFKRNQPIRMPLDFRVTLSDGSIRNFRIPAGVGQFSAPPADGSDLPVWPLEEDRFMVHLSFRQKMRSVQINPDDRLLDVNPFNNDSHWFPKIYWHFLHRQYLFPHLDGYTATVFPFAFYNDIDGLQLGIQTRGNFILPDYQHRSRILFGLKSRMPEVDFWFEHPLYSLNPNIHAVLRAFNAAGRSGGWFWLNWKTRQNGIITQALAGWQGRRLYDSGYPPYPVDAGNISYLETVLSKSHWATGFNPAGWETNLHGETSIFGSDFDYRRWTFENVARFAVPFSQKLTGRIMVGGIYGDPPLQKRFRPGGSDYYDMFSQPYLRAKGTLPDTWWKNGHIFAPGGGNLRSMAADSLFLDNHIFSIRGNLTLGNPLNLTWHYYPYLSDVILSVFTDWTSTATNTKFFETVYGEAGISLAFTRIPFLMQYFEIDQIYLEMPLWVNRNISSEVFAFRWTLRLDFRSFY